MTDYWPLTVLLCCMVSKNRQSIKSWGGEGGGAVDNVNSYDFPASCTNLLISSPKVNIFYKFVFNTIHYPSNEVDLEHIAKQVAPSEIWNPENTTDYIRFEQIFFLKRKKIKNSTFLYRERQILTLWCTYTYKEWWCYRSCILIGHCSQWAGLFCAVCSTV